MHQLTICSVDKIISSEDNIDNEEIFICALFLKLRCVHKDISWSSNSLGGHKSSQSHQSI
jgi:hypothetical protein